MLGALSLLLDGGGIGQLGNIVEELNNALPGSEIIRAIDGLNRLSSTLVQQRGN